MPTDNQESSWLKKPIHLIPRTRRGWLLAFLVFFVFVGLVGSNTDKYKERQSERSTTTQKQSQGIKEKSRYVVPDKSNEIRKTNVRTGAKEKSKYVTPDKSNEIRKSYTRTETKTVVSPEPLTEFFDSTVWYDDTNPQTSGFSESSANGNTGWWGNAGGNTGGRESNVESPAPSGTMVWLPGTGSWTAASKYHRINNCGNMNPAKAQQVTLEDAKKSYQPCKKCYPPL